MSDLRPISNIQIGIRHRRDLGDYRLARAEHRRDRPAAPDRRQAGRHADRRRAPSCGVQATRLDRDPGDGGRPRRGGGAASSPRTPTGRISRSRNPSPSSGRSSRSSGRRRKTRQGARPANTPGKFPKGNGPRARQGRKGDRHGRAERSQRRKPSSTRPRPSRSGSASCSVEMDRHRPRQRRLSAAQDREAGRADPRRAAAVARPRAVSRHRRRSRRGPTRSATMTLRTEACCRTPLLDCRHLRARGCVASPHRIAFCGSGQLIIICARRSRCLTLGVSSSGRFSLGPRTAWAAAIGCAVRPSIACWPFAASRSSTLTNQTTLLCAPVGAHSEKPVEFYALVETLCPAPRYANLFAGGYRHNERWDQHGDGASWRPEPVDLEELLG